MTRVLRFLTDLVEDALDGYMWYEAKAPGLGEDFLRAFYACATQISRNPLAYSKLHREFPRCLLRRFPHAVYFFVQDDEVVVAALFPCARDPRTLSKKLEDRGNPNA